MMNCRTPKHARWLSHRPPARCRHSHTPPEVMTVTFFLCSPSSTELKAASSTSSLSKSNLSLRHLQRGVEEGEKGGALCHRKPTPFWTRRTDNLK